MREGRLIAPQRRALTALPLFQDNALAATVDGAAHPLPAASYGRVRGFFPFGSCTEALDDRLERDHEDRTLLGALLKKRFETDIVNVGRRSRISLFPIDADIDAMMNGQNDGVWLRGKHRGRRHG